MKADWVTLEVTNSKSEADIIRLILEAEGIPVNLAGGRMQEIIPVTVDGLGEIWVQVPTDDKERARQIITSQKNKP